VTSRTGAVPGITAVESLLSTAAELRIHADLGVVDAAEKVLTTDTAARCGWRGSNPARSV
jgi:hypothetical protein